MSFGRTFFGQNRDHRRPKFSSFLQSLSCCRSHCRSIHRLQFWLGVTYLGSLTLVSKAVAQDSATVGQFSPSATWPYRATHAHVLPTGKVLWWPPFDNGDNPTFWDPL